MRIVITSGPTREPLDPVRYISNYSTGYMGSLLAREAVARGHAATVITGPVVEPLPPKARRIDIERADELARALRREAAGADAVIMAAAVCDFRPARRLAGKLARAGRLTLELESTPDIIGTLPQHPGQVRAGFAVESRGLLRRAGEKLRRKRLDLLVAQEVRAGAPFGRTNVRAWLLDRSGTVTSLGRASKARVAQLLLDKVETLWYGQTLGKDAHRKGAPGAIRLEGARGLL